MYIYYSNKFMHQNTAQFQLLLVGCFPSSLSRFSQRPSLLKIIFLIRDRTVQGSIQQSIWHSQHICIFFSHSFIFIVSQMSSLWCIIFSRFCEGLAGLMNINFLIKDSFMRFLVNPNFSNYILVGMEPGPHEQLNMHAIDM